MFKPIDYHTLNFDPFHKIGKDWLLISARKDGITNTMTASWGADRKSTRLNSSHP